VRPSGARPAHRGMPSPRAARPRLVLFLISGLDFRSRARLVLALDACEFAIALRFGGRLSACRLGLVFGG